MSSWAQDLSFQFVPVIAWKSNENESGSGLKLRITYQIKHGSKRDKWTHDKKHSNTKWNLGSKDWLLETCVGFMGQSHSIFQNFESFE